jgi:hypothetical protein
MPITSLLGQSIPVGSIGPTEIGSSGVTPGTYTNSTITVDEDGRLTFATSGSTAGIAFIEDKSSDATISGTINGINTVFNLANSPITDSLVFCLNGIIQESVTHYALSGTTVTLTDPPQTGDILSAYYAI